MDDSKDFDGPELGEQKQETLLLHFLSLYLDFLYFPADRIRSISASRPKLFAHVIFYHNSGLKGKPQNEKFLFNL